VIPVSFTGGGNAPAARLLGRLAQALVSNATYFSRDLESGKNCTTIQLARSAPLLLEHGMLSFSVLRKNLTNAAF
jgi:hypothetical protein